MPVAESVKAWWDTEWPAITQQPEYYSYVDNVQTADDATLAIPMDVVTTIASNNTSMMGLNNNYNGGRLVIAYAD